MPPLWRSLTDCGISCCCKPPNASPPETMIMIIIRVLVVSDIFDHMIRNTWAGKAWSFWLFVHGVGGGGGWGEQGHEQKQGRQQGPHLIIGPISESKRNQQLLTMAERDIEWRGTCLHDLYSSSYMHSNYSGSSLKLVFCYTVVIRFLRYSH